MEQRITRLEDLKEHLPKEDNIKPLKEFVGQTIVVYDIEERPSAFQFGKTYLVLDARVNGEDLFLSTGVGRIMRKLKAVKSFFPVSFKVIERGKSYDIE